MSHEDFSTKAGDYLRKAVQMSEDYLSTPKFTQEKVGKGPFGNVKAYMHKGNILPAMRSLSFMLTIAPYAAGLIYGASRLLPNSQVKQLDEDDLKNTGTNTLGTKASSRKVENKLLTAFNDLPYQVSLEATSKDSKEFVFEFSAKQGQETSRQKLEKALSDKFIGVKIADNNTTPVFGTLKIPPNEREVRIIEEKPGKFKCYVPKECASKAVLMQGNSSLKDTEYNELREILKPFGEAEEDMPVESKDGYGLAEIGVKLLNPANSTVVKELKKKFPDVVFEAKILPDRLSNQTLLYIKIAPSQARKMLNP